VNDAGQIAVAFTRVLRGAGLDVPVSATISFSEALAVLGLDSREHAYWAGRTTLVQQPDDVGTYDRVFRAFWDADTPPTIIEPEPETQSLTLAVDDEDGAGADGEGAGDDDEDVIQLRFSAAEVLRHRDFADYTADELAEAQRLMARLRLIGSPRRSLRLGPTPARTARPDLRRTVRAALRAGGEPIRVHHLTRRTRHRRLVLLLDVSGSMQSYARALLRFVHAAVVGRQKVEAFALGTRLTRLTRDLSTRDPDEALRNATTRMLDFGGGTRLGQGLRAFNDEWGQRGMARGAIVVFLSDGWDRGDPQLLGEQMERLHRVAHKVIWVNPLKVTPGYAPLARGMAAALPHIDDFVEGHSIAAMENLAASISAE
jgi:uncharacterized protein with von Willebrand factor type A (vWA) domain